MLIVNNLTRTRCFNRLTQEIKRKVVEKSEKIHFITYIIFLILLQSYFKIFDSMIWTTEQ